MKPLACIAAAAALSLCAFSSDVRASAPPQVARVRDLEYVHRTFYFIADHPIRIRPGTLHVWRDDRIGSNNAISSVPGIARVDSALADTTIQVHGNFDPLQPDEDYFVIYPWITGGPGDLPVLRLRQALNPAELLAVSYVDDLTGVHVGTTSSAEFASPDSALGKPANCLLLRAIGMDVNRISVDPTTGLYDPAHPFYRVLPYEIRNFYELGLTHIPKDRFQLRVRKIDLGSPEDPDDINGRPLIGVLGLDMRSPPGAFVPDGLVDDQFIDYGLGLLFFPDLHPFAPDTSTTWCAPGHGGFLCLDDLERNALIDPYLANPRVYYSPYPDLIADSRYYIEATVMPIPDPGGTLHQNAPNPFNPGTRIDFDLNLPGRARVSVYDIRGRLVSELLDRDMTAGHHYVLWDGKSGTRPVASGVYYYVLETGGHRYTRRMVLAR